MSTPQILLVFALPEERDHFINLSRIQTLPAEPTYPARLRLHEFISRKNALVRFFSYTLKKMGNHAVIDQLPEILKDLKPRFVINIGIAGRISDDLLIGDVVIGDSLLSFVENSKLVNKGEGIQIIPNGQGRQPRGNLTQQTIDHFDSMNDPAQTQFANRRLVFSAEEERVVLSYRSEIKIHKGPVITIPFVDTSTNQKYVYKNLSRKATVMEMEAYYVQQEIDKYLDSLDHSNHHTVQSLFIKSVSDYADENKGTMDAMAKGVNRKLAMFNNIWTFQRILDDVDLQIEASPIGFEHIDRIFNKKHLEGRKTRHWFTDGQNIDFDKYQRLFEVIVSYPRRGEFRLFDMIMSAIQNDETITISGFSGSGRSSLIIILYRFLQQRFRLEEVCPVYINIEYYYENSRLVGEELTSYIQRSLVYDLNNLERILAHLKPQKVVLLIDGIDCLRETEAIINYLEYDPGLRAKNWSRIFGVLPSPEKTILNFQPRHKASITGSVALQMRYFNYSDPGLKDLVKLLRDIKPRKAPNYDQQIISEIEKCKISNVDVLTLQLVDQKYDGNSLQITRLLEDYCRSELITAQYRFEDICQDAFDQHIVNYKIEPVFTGLSTWRLLHQNPKVTYYLIAKSIIFKILSAGEKNQTDFEKDLSFVFPYDINYFTKEIVNASFQTQQAVFVKIQRILQSDDWHTKAVACYLAGRFQDQRLIGESKSMLKKFLAENLYRPVGDADRKPYLFAIRTVYISLAYLGDRDTEEKYIEKLITEKEYDNINRGFHLVYYGDQEYIPDDGLAQIDMGQDFDKTFSQLMLRITQKNKSNIFNIEIFTLVSLAMHRLKNESLNKEKQARLIEVLNQSSVLYKVTSTSVSTFIKYAVPALKKEKYSLITPLEELYELKFHRRSGWLKRKIQDPESIASHILLTYYLAKFYLPETADLEGYNKQTVLNMILMHDIAESRFGDIIEKNEVDLGNEREYFSELSWVSYLLDNENDISKISDEWEDFENATTINGKIARELDRLEAFIQLLHYRNVKGQDISDVEVNNWYDKMTGGKQLQFECTRNILRAVLKHYNME